MKKYVWSSSSKNKFPDWIKLEITGIARENKKHTIERKGKKIVVQNLQYNIKKIQTKKNNIRPFCWKPYNIIILLVGDRYCVSKVSCPRTQHRAWNLNMIACARLWSRVDKKCGWLNIIFKSREGLGKGKRRESL